MAAERRALASRHMQACAAGICAGVQVFLLGTGAAVPQSANGAWIAGLVSLPVCALAAGMCRRKMIRGRITRIGAAFLAMAHFLCAAFACAALIALAEQSLLPQARALHIAALTAAAIALCAACGAGIYRVCFLIRTALPAAAIVCAAISLPDRSLSGVFPLLGAGMGPLGLSSLLIAAGCFAPVLMLLLPPPELEGLGDTVESAIPNAGFYAFPAALGALAGCALLFLLCAGGTPQALAAAAEWGARLALIAGGGTHQGIFDTALLLVLCAGCALLAGCMLLSCTRALRYAFPHIGERAGLFMLSLLLLFALVLLTARGLDAAAYAAPASALPALAALAVGRKTQKPKGGE